MSLDDKNSIYFSPEIDKVFSDILKMDKSINFVEFIKIYKKIKSLNPISDLEFSKITIFLNTRFYDLLNDYATSKNNINRALINKYKKIKISLEININKIKVINLIDLKQDNKYEKIVSNKKTYYVEILDEIWNYKIWYDIRKSKFVLFNKNIALLTSDYKIFFSNKISTKFWVLIESEWNNFCYVSNDDMITFEKSNYFIFKNNYWYSIVDKKTSKIIIIDKNWNFLVKDLSPNNILEIRNWYILCFVPANSSYDWRLSVYSLYENKEIIWDLDFRKYKFTKNYFIWKSTDWSIEYKIFFKNNQIEKKRKIKD